MGELFGSIYCWFEEFFGIELANYLWGQSSPLSQTNSYIGIGWTMLGISLAIVFNILLCNQSPSLEPLVGMGDFPYGKCSNKLYCGLAIGA